MIGLHKMASSAPEMPQTAFTAQRRLVEIQSFNDGNGRTARLLMNPVLTRCEYRSPVSFS